MALKLEFLGQTWVRTVRSILVCLEWLVDAIMTFMSSIVNFGNSGEKSSEFPKSGIRVPGIECPCIVGLHEHETNDLETCMRTS